MRSPNRITLEIVPNRITLEIALSPPVQEEPPGQRGGP